MDRRCGRVTHSLFAESKKEANQAKNSHVSLLKSLNQGEKQVWAISLHPKVVQTRLVFVDAGLSTAKPLSTCNHTSNNGRWMRCLEILPTAHARTHTHTNTQRCQKCTDLLSALRSACDWVRLTGKQSTRENNGVDGVTYVL